MKSWNNLVQQPPLLLYLPPFNKLFQSKSEGLAIKAQSTDRQYYLNYLKLYLTNQKAERNKVYNNLSILNRVNNKYILHIFPETFVEQYSKTTLFSPPYKTQPFFYFLQNYRNVAISNSTDKEEFSMVSLNFLQEQCTNAFLILCLLTTLSSSMHLSINCSITEYFQL